MNYARIHNPLTGSVWEVTRFTGKAIKSLIKAPMNEYKIGLVDELNVYSSDEAIEAYVSQELQRIYKKESVNMEEVKVTVVNGSGDAKEDMEVGIVLATMGYKYLERYQDYIIALSQNIVLSDEAARGIIHLDSGEEYSIPDHIVIDWDNETVTNELTNLRFRYTSFYKVDSMCISL